ncbi:MAG TPA: hypothetical protein DCE42_17440 [Myxococcales bacterium]|nr:hypothetical protein [Deltaproteobacteria bacterium]MBU52289.1 hypothetical protein [Deltaproteobacteria bacterium]HAA56554.1 hypothetical protein [Myxococcales bacterium]
MKFSQVCLPICLFALILVGNQNVTEACSPLPPKIAWTYPENGAKNVPINVQIWLQSENVVPIDGDVRLKDEAGNAVPFTKTFELGAYKLVPTGTLPPNTKYTVECNQCETWFDNQTTYSFTTGTRELAKPDTYAGAQDIKIEYVPAYKPQDTSNTCDGPRDAYFSVTVKGTEQTEAVMYQLERVGTGALLRGKTPELTSTLTVNEAGTEFCYMLKAIYPDGSSDGNTTKVCVTPEVPKGCACSQAQTQPPTSLWLYLFVLVGFLRVRRR